MEKPEFADVLERVILQDEAREGENVVLTDDDMDQFFNPVLKSEDNAGRQLAPEKLDLGIIQFDLAAIAARPERGHNEVHDITRHCMNNTCVRKRLSSGRLD